MATLGFLLTIATHVAICSSNAIPKVPGDNSHYVEGKSRYIWMPDGQGVPHLVDLQEPVDNTTSLGDVTRNGANNQYWLYTRRNPNIPQILDHGIANSVFGSNYDVNRPVKVIVHGWTGNGNSVINPLITAAFLALADDNVIVVDWSTVAGANYVSAMLNVPGVGRSLGDFLVWLLNITNGNWNHVHLVGHSLGAHVVGNAGRQANGLPGRVTGLDPAGPLWQTNSNTLSPASGQYVEAIHTDGFILGIFNPVGHADFYPNGGRHPQPGCSSSSCSHNHAHHLFEASVYYDHFVGRQCASLTEANSMQCFGGTLHMGNSVLGKRGSGLYALSTRPQWPY